jgi:hypothetical protein
VLAKMARPCRKARFGSTKKFREIMQLRPRHSTYLHKAASPRLRALGDPMSLLERISTLSDEEVVNLLANAQRLIEQGDDKQRAAASELLPALEAEAAERRAERMERAKAKRAATRRATTSARSAAA